MCAIFGIYGENNLKLLKRMSNCQLSRGPDSQSFYSDKINKFSFGMNRLAVIDKKNGKQPMFSFDKNYLTPYELEDFINLTQNDLWNQTINQEILIYF